MGWQKRRRQWQPERAQEPERAAPGEAVGAAAREGEEVVAAVPDWQQQRVQPLVPVWVWSMPAVLEKCSREFLPGAPYLRRVEGWRALPGQPLEWESNRLRRYGAPSFE